MNTNRAMHDALMRQEAFKRTLLEANDKRRLPKWQTVHHPFSARANLSEERTTDKG